MAKYHYSERIGDFAKCTAATSCPLGDAKHIEVSDDMTIGDFNKLKEEFYKEQYNGNLSNGLTKSTKNKNNQPFNGEDYDPNEYTMKINDTIYITQLVEPGSTFAFKNKIHQVKDTDFDKFSGEITITTTNDEKITFNENSSNSFRASAKEALLANLNGSTSLDNPLKQVDWLDTTKQLPLSELRPGVIYADYKNAEPKLVVNVTEGAHLYNGDELELELMDAEGNVTKETIGNQYGSNSEFYTVANKRFDAEKVSGEYYSGEKYFEGPPSDEEAGEPEDYTKTIGLMNWKDNLKEGTIFRQNNKNYKVKSVESSMRKSDAFGDEEFLKIETTDGEKIYYDESTWKYDDYDKIFIKPENGPEDDYEY